MAAGVTKAKKKAPRASASARVPREKSKGGYSGRLAEPIELPPETILRAEARDPGFCASDPERERLAFFEKYYLPLIDQQEQEKLPLLFKHCGLDADDPAAWQRLALMLARKHVPGFRVVAFQYELPKKWNEFEHADLYLAVRDKRAGKRTMSEHRAVQLVAESATAKSRGWSRKESALWSEYQRAKRSAWVRLLEDNLAEGGESLAAAERLIAEIPNIAENIRALRGDAKKKPVRNS